MRRISAVALLAPLLSLAALATGSPAGANAVRPAGMHHRVRAPQFVKRGRPASRGKHRRAAHRHSPHRAGHAPAPHQLAGSTQHLSWAQFAASPPTGSSPPAAAQPAAQPAPVTARAWRGFNENVVPAAMDASALAAWDLRAGATVDRYTLHWSGVYPDSASQLPSWSNYDAIYKILVAAAIRPVIMVVRAPIWAVGSGGANPCDPLAQGCAPAPSFDSAFADFVAQVAQRYPKAAAIEIWNEENAASTWGSWVDPSGYADLLAAAYGAIKRVAPSMPVLMGGLAEHAYNEYANGRITFMTDSEFLAGVYSAWRSRYSGRVYMDGISVHPYGANMSLASAFGMLDRVRDVRNAFGDGGRPLYATETGISPQLAGISDDQAALTDAELLQALPASDVQGPLLHTLVDVWGSTEDYGMLTPAAGGFIPKSSFCAVAAANGSGFICPQPAADPAQQARWAAQRLLHDAYEVARGWWASHGSFGGFTNAALASADPQLDATVPAWPLTPGPSADPRQIAIASSGDMLMLCNASQADLSYCIFQTAAVAQGATNEVGAGVTYASGPDSQSAVGQAQALAGLTGGWPR